MEPPCRSETTDLEFPIPKEVLQVSVCPSLHFYLVDSFIQKDLKSYTKCRAENLKVKSGSLAVLGFGFPTIPPFLPLSLSLIPSV